MSARIFIRLMLLLLVFTTILLVVVSGGPRETPNNDSPSGAAGNSGTQVQSADGSMLLEAVSSHLLNVMQ